MANWDDLKIDTAEIGTIDGWNNKVDEYNKRLADVASNLSKDKLFLEDSDKTSKGSLHITSKRGNALNLIGETHAFLQIFPKGISGNTWPHNRKAWFGFGGANTKNLDIRNEYEGGRLQLKTFNSQGLVIDSKGNVGIGTDAPEQEIHLFKDYNNATQKDWNVDFLLEKKDVSTLKVFTGSTACGLIGGGNIPMKFGVKGSTKLTINQAGNVGIGIESPAEKLHVNGSIRGSDATKGALRINTPTGWVDVGSKTKDWAHFYTDRPKYYFNKEIRVDSGKIGNYFHATTPAAHKDLNLCINGVSKLIIKQGGNVGIGTDTPKAKLDVNGDFNIKGAMPFEFERILISDKRVFRHLTNKSVSEWNVAVVGFEVWGDIHESKHGRILMVRPIIEGNVWVIHGDSQTNHTDSGKENWVIDVMYVKTEISNRLNPSYDRWRK